MSEYREIWIVDRIREGTCVLVDDATGRTLEIAQSLMPSGHVVAEGTVLMVPVTDEGGLDWMSAEADEELQKQRLGEAEEVLDDLKKRDPGGDVEL